MVLIILIPVTFLVLRYSKPVPEDEVAATYGVPQKPVEEDGKVVTGQAQEATAGANMQPGDEATSDSEEIKAENR